MMRYLFLKSRYDAYLRHEHGIKKFAEMTMGQLIHRVKKKGAFYREMNENLLVEKANLRLRETELHRNAMLDAGEFFSVRRRMLTNGFIIFAIVIAAVFINYLAITGFLGNTTASPLLTWVVSAVLAVVLTGGGTVVSERMFDTLQPKKAHRTVDYPAESRSILPLWIALLAGIELALLGLAEVQASNFSKAQQSLLLYVGFITLSMMFPVLAGAIRWDSMRFLDIYKSTLALRQIESRLAQIDSVLRQNEEYESGFYKIRSIYYWDILNDFKTLKDNYNRKHGFEENLTGHFALSYDTYQQEANKRYHSDIRDVTATSIRKLQSFSGATGHKMGQPVPPADRLSGDGKSGDGIYQRPKAVR